MTGANAGTIAGSHSQHTRVRPFSRSSLRDSELTAKRRKLLAKEQCGFRPQRSTTDMLFTGRRLQGLGRKARVPLFLCFINLQKAYGFVDRTLLRQVLAPFGVPPQMIELIHLFQEKMGARARKDDSRCSE